MPVPGSPLARLLRKELRGDVLFDAASRGRYSTDASIYQIMPLGVVVPRDQADLILALDIARIAEPRSWREGGDQPMARPWARRSSSTTGKWLNNVVSFDAQARLVTVEPGIVLDHLNAWLKPHGLWFPVERLHGGAMYDRRHGRQQFVRLALDRVRQHGAHTCTPSTLSLPTGRRPVLLRCAAIRSRGGWARYWRDCGSIAERENREIVERVPKVLRRVGGYNIDIFDCQNPRSYTDDGLANLAHILVGSKGPLAASRQLTLRALAAAGA
ncbi:FAD-binding oxidoreductase [Cupriavidus basilensis]